MHILYTVLHTYPKAMARRIYLTIRSFLSLRFFSLFKGDTVGRNKFDLGTGGGGQRRLRISWSMVSPLYSVGDDWFPVRSLRKPCDPLENPSIPPSPSPRPSDEK